MRPYLLARVLLGLGVFLTLSYGALIAVRAIMKRGEGATEEALTLDRRAELMAVIVKVATLCASLGLFATVLAADRAHESIRGAMCAYGVLTSTGALLVCVHRFGAGPRRFAADVDQICAGCLQRQRRVSGPCRLDETAAIAQVVGGHVEDAHNERPLTEL